MFLPRTCRFSTVLALSAVFMLTAPATRADQLQNGRFRSDSDGDGVADHWQKDSSTGLQGDYAVVRQDGRQCQMLTLHTPLQNMQIFRVSQVNIPARAEGHFLLTGEIKAETAGAVFFYERLKDGKYLTHPVKFDVKNRDWQKVSLLVKTSPLCRSFKLSLIVHGIDKPIWFSNFAVIDVDAPPRRRVPQLETAPAMSADWDDPAWQTAAAAASFMLRGQEVKLPLAQTEARLALTGQTLHLILRCEEPRLADVLTQSGGTWADDTVEVFIKNPADGALHQFGLTPAGARLDRVSTDGATGFHTDWFSRATTASPRTERRIMTWNGAVSRQQTAWTAQFAVTLPEDMAAPTGQLDLLLARSRKLSDLAEDSSWGRTGGDFFRGSTCFARLALAPAPGATPSGPVLDALPPPPPGSLVVPTPQNLHATNAGTVRLTGPVSVFAAPEAALAREALATVFRSRFGMETMTAHDRGRATVVLQLAPELSWPGSDRLAPWQLQEGYRLTTGAVSTATARTHRGLVHAIQTLAQLADGDANTLRLRPAEVTDWPDLAWRGWHVTAPQTRRDVPEALKVIDLMAALKMNWIAIQFDNRFQYERHPGLSGPDAPTKDDHRQLAARIALYGMDVIPMTQCLSHFNYFLKLPAYRHLAEIPDPGPDTGRKQLWNYCPRHPDIHAMVFDMIEEHLECYPQAKWYHVGLDEITFEAIGVCERCRDASGGVLLAEEVNRLHRFLTAKGKRMGMWGDQLLVEHNGGKPFHTAEALPDVPRDVVIFDWHYAETTQFPSVQFFKKHGFDVMGCGWFFPENVVPFIDETFRQKVLGYGGTTWTSIAQIRHKFQLMTAFVLTGERCWKKSSQPLADLPFRPIDVFRTLYDGASARRPAQFRDVPIAAWGTMSLAGGGPHAWMGLGPEHDASALPVGRSWFAGVPFTIPDTARPVVALASEKDDPALVPDSAWQLPVGGKVAGLAFLQTCSVPEQFQRHMYDRAGVNPVRPAQYVIHYEDGGSETLPLTWGVTLSSWNTQVGSSDAVIGWQGKTRGGAQLSVEVLTWWNPRPEIAVVAIDFLSSRNTVRPALLALTAIVK